MAGTSVAPHPHYRVRQFNKHVLNPVMRLAAGRRHWYAAALHHVGRRSGRAPLKCGSETPEGIIYAVFDCSRILVYLIPLGLIGVEAGEF